MHPLAHHEDGRGSYPRHPLVCFLDAVGFCVTIALIVVYKPSPVTAILPIAISLQYAVSFYFHWMPYSRALSKIDRSVIFLLIAATYMPYWGNLLPVDEAVHRLPWVWIAAAVGIVLVLSDVSAICIGIFWAAFASAGLIISFRELQVWLPPDALSAFWLASILYGAQQMVFALRLPNPMPELFGFREVQHVLLLIATTTSSIVAMCNT